MGLGNNKKGRNNMAGQTKRIISFLERMEKYEDIFTFSRSVLEDSENYFTEESLMYRILRPSYILEDMPDSFMDSLEVYQEVLTEEVDRFDFVFGTDTDKSVYAIVDFYSNLADFLHTDYDDSSFFDFLPLYDAILYRDADGVKAYLDERYPEIREKENEIPQDILAIPVSEEEYQEYYEAKRFDEDVDKDPLGIDDFKEQLEEEYASLPVDLRPHLAAYHEV